MSGSDADRDSEASTELVRRIRSGEAGAWEDLYLRYHDALLFSIRCRLSPALRARVASEDIFQSVVKDALSDFARFEPRGPGSLSRYLHAAVLNKIRNKADWHGAAKRAGDAPLTDSLAGRLAARDGEPRYADEERWERLERALAELEPRAREVVILRTVEGLTNAEAAEAAGCSPEATSKLYNRALTRLGARLAPER
jgi:RNA polymerase sigma-70 factor (ECF subfamily)